MKKTFALVLSVLFVLSFAASAFAIHAEIPAETQSVVAKGTTQITLGGELRTRGWYENNISGTTGNPVDANSEAWYDQRLRLSVDAMVSPNVQGYVQLETNINRNPNTGRSSDVYTWGTGINVKPDNSALNLLQAWILYKGEGLLGIPAGLKIGHMPLALGEKQFFDNTQFGDDAIVFFMDPTKELHVGLLSVKFGEASLTDNTDDTDGYVGLMTYKWDDKNTVGLNYTYLNNSDGRFSLQDLGLHANGNISGLGYKIEGDMQFGDMDDVTEASGWAVMAGLSYKLDPVTLRASFAMGSGDDDATDDENDTFVTFVGTQQHYTFVYDYRVNTAAGSTGTGISNTTYYNLGLDFAPTKEIAASLDGYLLQATEDNAAGEDELGWEVDAMIKYQIAKNLSYTINLGYLDAGDFYGDQAESATAMNHILTLSF